MKRAALPFSIAAILCCLMVCNTAEKIAEVIARGEIACIQVECEERSKSIREQLQMQIGAILQAPPEGQSEAGTYVFPMPLVPANPNQSAE